jgi:endonuclease-3 related protein
MEIRDEAGPLPLYYQALLAHFGHQQWWPARTRFEVIAGAILTQNTAWTNVERALDSLRHARALNVAGIRSLSTSELGRLIRSSGYWRQKAQRLKLFVRFLDERYHGNLGRLLRVPATELRSQLLSVPGIGPETADCIILYAARQPSFVIDAYTRRLLSRHGIEPPPRPSAHAAPTAGESRRKQRIDAPKSFSYEELQSLFHAQLPPDPQLYNEFHALLVQTGKHFCLKSEPRCAQCPLRPFLPPATDPAKLVPAHAASERPKSQNAVAPNCAC